MAYLSACLDTIATSMDSMDVPSASVISLTQGDTPRSVDRHAYRGDELGSEWFLPMHNFSQPFSGCVEDVALHLKMCIQVVQLYINQMAYIFIV